MARMGHRDHRSRSAAGTALLLWLGERITLHGVGNGFWLIVITPDTAHSTSNAAGTFELLRMGAITSGAVIAELVLRRGDSAPGETLRTTGAASTESRVSGADFVSIWPPLLAAYVNEFQVTISGVEISFAAQLALLAGVIAAVQRAAVARHCAGRTAAGLGHRLGSDLHLRRRRAADAHIPAAVSDQRRLAHRDRDDGDELRARFRPAARRR